LKKANATNQNDESSERHSRLQAIANKLSVHCTKIRAFVNAIENAQISEKNFNLSKPFYTTDSKTMTEAIKNLSKTYEALRLELRDIAQIGYVSFEEFFPQMNVNFETYYSVAASLLNLGFQMHLMRLYCYRLLKP